MKYIILIVLIIIAGAGWYYWQGNSEETEQQETTTEDGMMREEENVQESSDTNIEMSSELETGTDAGMEFPIADIDTDVKTFTVSGTNYAFDVKEIRVQEGDTVTINFSSAGGFHDWVVDEFNAATGQVRPGVETSVTFVADTKGTYEYYCSVGNHRALGMVGTLIVE